MDLATHDIDLTSWVTGRDYASVTAHTVADPATAFDVAAGWSADADVVIRCLAWEVCRFVVLNHDELVPADRQRRRRACIFQFRSNSKND